MPASLPDGLTASPASLDDVDDVVVLTQLVDLRTIGQIETSPSDLLARFTSHGVDPATAGLVVRKDQQVVGFVLVEPWSPGHLVMHTWSHPAFWDDDDLDEWLIESGVELARAEAARRGGTGWQAVMFTLEDDQRHGLIQELGFKNVGVNWHMEIRFDRRAPDVPRAPDLHLRHPVGESDLRLVHDLLERAFAERPGSRVEAWEQFHAERIQHPSFDAGLWFIVERSDGVPIGACIASCEDQARSGWIRKLGVVPAERGKGVGMTLLRATFRAFHERGIGRVELGVDATPEEAGRDLAPGNRATALYERAGMHTVFTHIRHHLAL